MPDSYVDKLEAALAHLYVRGCADPKCWKCALFAEVRARHPEPGISPEDRRARDMAAMGLSDDPNDVSRAREYSE